MNPHDKKTLSNDRDMLIRVLEQYIPGLEKKLKEARKLLKKLRRGR